MHSNRIYTAAMSILDDMYLTMRDGGDFQHRVWVARDIPGEPEIRLHEVEFPDGLDREANRDRILAACSTYGCNHAFGG